VRAWDSVVQPAVEMAKDSDGVKSFNRTEDFVPLAMAVASTTESYRVKLSFEAVNGVSSSCLLWEVERFCRIFLHLSLRTHTSSCPLEEP